MLVALATIPTPARTAFFDALAEAAARAGKRFHVLYCAKTERGRHWAYDASRMRHAHTVLRGFHPSLTGIHAHLNPGVLAELNLLKPDTLLVAGSWNTPTMLVAGLNIYSPPPRRFFWSEGHADAVLHKSGLIAWLRRRIYRTFDGFAVPNAKSAEWALAQAGGTRQLIDLPNAIDAKFFACPSTAARKEARRYLGLEGQGRVLVQVSALTARKGVLELAKAFLGIAATERRGALREEAAAVQQPQAMGSEMLSVHGMKRNSLLLKSARQSTAAPCCFTSGRASWSSAALGFRQRASS